MTHPVLVIGPGRLGLNLAYCLAHRGWPKVTVWTPSSEEATRTAAQSKLPVTCGPAPPDPGDDATILIATPDDTIGDVARALAQAGLGGSRVWLHTSGSLPGAVLEREGGATACGSLHPPKPFSGFYADMEAFVDLPMAIGGDAEAKTRAHDLALALGARPFEVAESARPLYHAACVVTSNLPVVLAGVAESLLDAAHIDPTHARTLVAGLMGGALANLEVQIPVDALTGPLARGDAATIARHARALDATDEHTAAAYRALVTAAIEWLRGSAGTKVSEEMLDTIRTIIAS